MRNISINILLVRLKVGMTAGGIAPWFLGVSKIKNQQQKLNSGIVNHNPSHR